MSQGFIIWFVKGFTYPLYHYKDSYEWLDDHNAPSFEHGTYDQKHGLNMFNQQNFGYSEICGIKIVGQCWTNKNGGSSATDGLYSVGISTIENH